MLLYKNILLKKQKKQSAFTIVELLIVIVVIAILAALVIVAYNGLSNRAVKTTLQSDLKNASTLLKLYEATNGNYPTSNDCSGGNNPAPPVICLKTSPGNVLTYSADNMASPPTYSLTAVNGDIAYSATNTSGPSEVATTTVTGGTVTTDGAYTIRTFTSNGTLAVSGGAITANILIVGGGGGSSDGGGGAGEFLKLDNAELIR